MHHFFDAITNNKGDALTGYYVRLVDSGGTGATLYADTSLTPIVSVSGLADAARVDGDGNVDFYVAVGTYQLNIYATDGATLVKSIADVGMNIDADTAATALAAQAAASSSATAAASSASAASSSATAAASSATTASGSAAIALSAVSGIDVSTAVVPVINRTALSTLATGIPAYLKESGREGMFVFDSSNLSAMVTADPNQAIYVAPSSATSGASGAWVRKFNGKALTTWWGLSTANTAAANGAAMDACMATLRALKATGYGYAYGSVGVHTPKGVYALDRTITLEASIDFSGDGGPMGAGTVFTFPATTKGMEVQGWDGSDRHGTGSTIHGIHLKGTFSGTNSTSAHGMEVQTRVTVRDFFIENFDGYGIYAWGNTAGPQGNANICHFENGNIQGCSNGTYTDNNDGNAMAFINVSVASNRLSGHYDSSFLGCYYAYGNIATNGLTVGFATRCVYSGNLYSVRQGQESWCSTNAPSGTTANNQGWQYMRAGTANTSQPAWTTGLTWYFSAPLCNDNDNQTSTFYSVYWESDANPGWLRGQALVLGGFPGSTIYEIASGTVYGGWLRGAGTNARFGHNLQVDAGVTASGNTSYFGPQSANQGGTTGDADVQIHNLNTGSQVSFYSSGVLKGYVLNSSGNNFYNANAHNFRSAASTAWATIDTSGMAVKIGTLGYATGAGGAVTQATSRATGVTLNKGCGQITLVSATGSASWQSFTVTNSTVAATDVIRLNQASGTDLYMLHVTNVAAGSFKVSFATTGGTTTEQPVFNFAVIKSVNA